LKEPNFPALKEVFPVPVPAACHLAEEDLMVSDLVLVNYGAVGLGECSLDDRNSVVGDIEFTPVEPFTAADREAAGARFLFRSEDQLHGAAF
jgi:hypothetical protein